MRIAVVASLMFGLWWRHGLRDLSRRSRVIWEPRDDARRATAPLRAVSTGHAGGTLLAAGGRMQMAWGWSRIRQRWRSVISARPPRVLAGIVALPRCRQTSAESGRAVPLLGCTNAKSSICAACISTGIRAVSIGIPGLPFAPLNPAYSAGLRPWNARTCLCHRCGGEMTCRTAVRNGGAGVVESAQFEFFYLGEHICSFSRVCSSSIGAWNSASRDSRRLRAWSGERASGLAAWSMCSAFVRRSRRRGLRGPPRAYGCER